MKESGEENKPLRLQLDYLHLLGMKQRSLTKIQLHL